MKTSLGRGLKKKLEDVAIRRGRGVGGYQVATGDNDPQIFKGVISLDTQTLGYMQRFQNSEDLFYVLFDPKLKPFMISGNSTNLRKNDQIIRINQMDRSVKKDTESDNDLLIRDIKNTNSGVLTITHIESDEKLQICRCSDITSPIGGRG